jgi:predicted DsbA family dithiol-disulfide isomerase
MTLVIDVISDVVCPWCFLGKRRLDKAIAESGQQVIVRWRPFQLDPTIPEGGIDRTEYMTSKFGAERLKTLHDPLIEAGKEDGVPYRFDAITRSPNTLKAHALLRLAAASGKQHAVAERLFIAYWNEGRDVGDETVLQDIAKEMGLGAVNLSDPALLQSVKTEISHAQKMGITGVPAFIFAEKYGLSGAQSADILKLAIARASQESGAAGASP